MTSPPASPAAAYLAETAKLVAERNGLPPTAATEIDVADFKLASRVPVLVAALEAALALAGEWENAALPSRDHAKTLREAVEDALRDAQRGAG